MKTKLICITIVAMIIFLASIGLIIKFNDWNYIWINIITGYLIMMIDAMKTK